MAFIDSPHKNYSQSAIQPSSQTTFFQPTFDPHVSPNIPLTCSSKVPKKHSIDVGSPPASIGFHQMATTIQLPRNAEEFVFPSQIKLIDSKKTPKVIEYNSEMKKTGVLKFFNADKRFGFIIGDHDRKDIFFHFQDMESNGIEEKLLLEGKRLRFSYVEMKYSGKKNIAKKAVDIRLIV